MIRVVATGTFDILHPGHLHYLSESAALGDELYVIIARDKNVRHKPRPVVPEMQRLCMVDALKPVTKAVLGDMDDMFAPVRMIKPDIITLGYNQHFKTEDLARLLVQEGITAEVVRISEYATSPFTSSSMIVKEILARDRHNGIEPEDYTGR
ncbi:MAG: FAD synthase [Methanospirillaceae archaeon]|nr:FAD synthase [Methanospirillaceae archaeon]